MLISEGTSPCTLPSSSRTLRSLAARSMLIEYSLLRSMQSDNRHVKSIIDLLLIVADYFEAGLRLSSQAKRSVKTSWLMVSFSSS